MATSELNQFLEDVDEKVLECTICSKRLQNPKSLKCLHSFCLACLKYLVKVKGKLTCPICSKSYPLPEGGLQKLPPSTFINNLLETIEQLSERNQKKCVCKKEKLEYYCQECRQYLCSSCSDHHKDFRFFANHKLHSVEDVRSMSLIQKASLHPPQCLLHSKPFEFYCKSCKIPICGNCTIMDHKEWKGKHKPIRISEAFQAFKETSATLEKAADHCKNKLQDCLQLVIKNGTELGKSKETCLRDIKKHVRVMIKKIEENGEKIKTEVETIYKEKKKVNDEQISELKKTISDINTKLIFLNQLLKSNEATAMQSSETVITALKDRIKILPKTDPNDDGEIKFHKHQNSLLQQCDIGYILHSHMRAADCFTLLGEESVSQGQEIVFKVIKTDKCEIQANQLMATWTQPTGETNIIQVQEDQTGDYIVTKKCLRPGVCKLGVSTYGKPIKQSPMTVNVEKKRLVNTIQVPVIYDHVRDVVQCEDDCLLVSCRKNEILKYKQSGLYIDKVTLPQGVQVNRMFKMKNGNIAFSDLGNKCIKECNMNGQVVRSIGQGELLNPSGIHVDEANNVVYVGDWDLNYVFMFDYDDKMKKQIGSKSNHENKISRVFDVTLTNQGNLLILHYKNQGLQLFDNEGRFLKVLVETGCENDNVWGPRGVAVDEDENIIISSDHKLQLFSSDGTFIKRIDKPEDGIGKPYGVCIISHHPRRVAVASDHDKSVKIFNYCLTENRKEFYFKMATRELNQFLEDVDEKVLECTICFSRLQNPKSLNCLHSFCFECLENWVKVKGILTCPTCSKSYPFPEGGLQKLPPNTFINNLLETIEQLPERDQKKCVCKKGKSEYYCQECRQYLCSACSDHHKDFRLFANHKLHSVENLRSMSPTQKALLHTPQCLLHTKPLEFYCTSCKIPICVNCTIMNHKEWEGKHKPISISEAFQTFKETSATLEEAAQQCKNKLQDCLKVVIENDTKLGQSKDTCLRDIDMHVQVMIRKMEENGDKIKIEVETIYKQKKKANDVQIDELKATISYINTKLSFLNQLLKSDEATAMQSSETVITALKDRIKVLPKTESDDGEMKFHEHQHSLFQQRDIGYISHMRAADYFTLKWEESVSQDQKFVVKVIKTDECEIQANQLKATWTQPAGETNITQVQQDENGDYFVTGKCSSPGVCKLDVSINGKPIKQSPMTVKIEKEGIVNTINVPLPTIIVKDIVKCEDDCLLVSCGENEILKYRQSGENIGKVTLLQGVRVNRMFKMKNGNIAFSDVGNECIIVCNMNGQVAQSIGHGILKIPSGIHVDDISNVVFVGDWYSDYVFMFDFNNENMIKQIGPKSKRKISRAFDVTLTNQGNLLILYYTGLQLFTKEGRFLKVLVETGDENGKVRCPRGVVVDEDDNIIISSEQKLQLFSSDGNFIKRIDKPEDGITDPHGVCIISHYPRRVAVANGFGQNIKIFNY
ncbi:uncharacterized protein LOC117118739 [Anneissia japonica]|uniref:uncharacterized protein LOC117118739 n=1 Tax=Anneissia japonica TaxID=1529436 RepID=UPI0014258356|nr:uncharacterized protein LOC117118739 [Anneissia japonica]